MDALTKAAQFLKQHAAGERSFGRALQTFFREQAERIAAVIADEGSHVPLPLVFNPYAEHERLQPIVRRNLMALMAAGANSELEALERRREARKSTDAFDAEYMERFDLSAGDVARLFFESMPATVRASIFAAVDNSTRQPYWIAIQNGVSADLGQIIKTSMAEGDTVPTLAKRIREQLGGDDARVRAASIATTETTMALNAGHYEALQSIDASELVLGREWLAVGDDVTRETHMDANGQKVGKGEPFVVGGNECDYPGDVSLPAEERARCRCTCIGVIAS